MRLGQPFKTLSNNMFRVFIIFLFTFIVFYFLNYDNLKLVVFPYRDLAADMLLTNKAYDNTLLYGQYSRFGFNHPGPFFFYVNILFEQILIPFDFSRFQTWLLASISIYSLFIAIAVKLILNLIDKKNILVYGLLISALFISLYSNVLPKDHYPYIWMPSKVVLPYLVFILTLPFILQREYKYIPLSFLFMGICIHGYIVLPIMTIPILLLVFVLSLYQSNKPLDKSDYKSIYLGLFIGLVFASPILIELFIHIHMLNESNLYKIISTLQKNHEYSSIEETFLFFKSYYNFLNNWIVIVLGLIGILMFFYNSKKIKKYFLELVMINFLITVIFILYYYNAPKPLYEFVGRYYHSIPISIFLFLVLMIFIPKQNRLNKVVQTISLILLSYYIYTSTDKTPKFTQSLYIGQFANKIKEITKQDNGAFIKYEEHMLWPQMSGILLELDRQNYNACTTKNTMSFLYTKEKICDKDVIPNIELINSAKCYNKCIYKSSGFGIIPLNNN